MADTLPLETSFLEKRLQIGYRRVRLRGESPLGPAGAGFTGHEFRYASVLAEGPGEALFDAEDACGDYRAAVGLVVGRVAGSFVHLIDRAA
jgi:cobyrinic acid a,c-diamide synthase